MRRNRDHATWSDVTTTVTFNYAWQADKAEANLNHRWRHVHAGGRPVRIGERALLVEGWCTDAVTEAVCESLANVGPCAPRSSVTTSRTVDGVRNQFVVETQALGGLKLLRANERLTKARARELCDHVGLRAPSRLYYRDQRGVELPMTEGRLLDWIGYQEHAGQFAIV